MRASSPASSFESVSSKSRASSRVGSSVCTRSRCQRFSPSSSAQTPRGTRRCPRSGRRPGSRSRNSDRRPSALSDGTRSHSRIPSESAACHRPPRKATPRWSRDPWKNRRSDSPRCCETRASCAGEPMKGVLIIAEHLEGRLAPSTPELITTGRSLAAALGGAARIAVLGSGVRELADRLAGYTLDVLLAEHPALAEYTGDGYVRAVRGIVESNSPRAILVAHTSQGYDFASALAGAMDLPLVTNCLGLDVDGDRLVATRRLLNEKVQAKVEIHSERPIVVTMRPGAEKPMGPGRGMMTVTAVPVVIEPSAIRETFLRLERPQVQDIDLSGADIIVSAGRGIQKKENLVLIEEFAKAIGGVVGASRPLTDMDWL